MKIAFVDTPSPWLVRPHAQIPLGPLYLATILVQAGHHAIFTRPKQLEELNRFRGWDVIAFTGTTLEFPMVVQCAEWLKKNCPELSLWYGGPHVTALHDEVSKLNIFDALAIGEAETYILKMVEDLAKGSLQPTYKADGFISELDNLPFPDRMLLEGDIGGDVFSFGANYKGKGNAAVITSRGCPYNCSFCASFSMWRQKVRFRSPANVLSEIRQVIKTTGCNQIRFADDNFTTNKQRLFEICNGLKIMDVAWRCSARVQDLTPEVCVAMAEAGCKEVSPGIETGDQRVLDFLDKKSTLEHALNGCRNATEADINVRVLFMIGTPGEFPDTPEVNRDFLEKLPFHSLTLSTFVPMPGSNIYLHPEKYKCEIVTKDFRRYNKDFWVSIGNTKEKRAYIPLIRNMLLTEEQQIDNVARMEQYALDTGRLNQG